MTPRTLARTGLALLLLTFVCLHAAAVATTAFNWDEFALFDRTARSLGDGLLRASNHAGLAELLLAPFVEGCRDEIATGRAARALWLAITGAYLAGVATLLAELLRGRPRRWHDAALGTALLGLLPAFLEWSLQVRSDQLALAAASWGGAALLASRRRPALALPAGLCFGIGWLASQKAAYVVALAGLLALGQLLHLREWRPARDAGRALVAGVALRGVIFAYHQLVQQRFVLLESHPSGALPEAQLVARQLDVFRFYRHTIGYDQYLAMLPSLAPHGLLLALLATATLATRDRPEQRGWLALAWAVLALGFAVGAFHAAAFAYFWLTLGLFPALALAIGLEPIRALLFEPASRWLRRAGAALWIALAIPAALASAERLRDTQAVQRESIAFVRRNFAPDQPGFQPESALFCGIEQPFGTWMSFTLYEHFGGERAEHNTERMLARFREVPLHYLVQSFRLNQFPLEIRRFWAENYQPYRASVFVPGRRLAGRAGETARFEIVVPGRYRWLPLAGAQPLVVDALPVAAGGALELEAGPHSASFAEDVPDGALVLALEEPPGPAPLSFYKGY